MSMSSVQHLRNSRVSHLFLFSFIFFFTYFPGLVLSAVVTLSSIEIFTTHEWLKATPTLYFQCTGDKNKTHLPDVKKKHLLYAFKGEESWQPLTEFIGIKCKRCGFYEEDHLLSDDVFDEWELCPSDFAAPDGKYVHFKEKEFNASFVCPECLLFSKGNTSARDGNHKEKGMHTGVIILLSILVSTVVFVGAIGAYKYWQKRKRQQDQARFLKLFEEVDDIEDELGLGTII